MAKTTHYTDRTQYGYLKTACGKDIFDSWRKPKELNASICIDIVTCKKCLKKIYPKEK